VCAAHRSPPLQPDVVRRQLETEKCFTAKADIEVVDQLYRDFFDGIIKFARELDFCDLQWGSTEAKALVEVLPRFAALTSLMLDKHPLPVKQLKGEDPVEAINLAGKRLTVLSAVVIASLIGSNTATKLLNLDGIPLPIKQLKGEEHVEEIDLSGKRLGVASAVVIASLIGSNTATKSLKLDDNQLCGLNWRGEGTYTAEGVVAISDMLRVNRTLRSVSLSNNNLDAEAAKHLSNALVSNQSLVELCLAKNNLTNYGEDMSGVIQLAEALKTNSCLQRLDLTSNHLVDAAKKQLQDASLGRAIKLQL